MVKIKVEEEPWSQHNLINLNKYCSTVIKGYLIKLHHTNIFNMLILLHALIKWSTVHFFLIDPVSRGLFRCYLASLLSGLSGRSHTKKLPAFQHSIIHEASFFWQSYAFAHSHLNVNGSTVLVLTVLMMTANGSFTRHRSAPLAFLCNSLTGNTAS